MSPTTNLILSIAGCVFPLGCLIYGSLADSIGVVEKMRAVLMWVAVLGVGVGVLNLFFWPFVIGLVAGWVANKLPSDDPRLQHLNK